MIYLIRPAGEQIAKRAVRANNIETLKTELLVTDYNEVVAILTDNDIKMFADDSQKIINL